ncbi:MAG: peptide chain release factor N(5)-glutamine methyltransferase [Gemmatimonadetes bacterium]|nr:peptide chain release factor N(5)-glutamine methyltransferase [Gemmatimonadota bacterium]
MSGERAQERARGARGRELWTVLRLVEWSARYLREKGVENARLNAELLLADALGLRRLELYLQYDRPLTSEELAAFKARLLRRARREPLQYVLGRVVFRELELAVDRRALIPRPETEILVGEVLEWARGRTGEPEVLELGTGSGAIALSLAVEGRFARVVATDVSPEALALARWNAARCGVARAVEFRGGSLYRVIAPDERFDAIVSNPPYVAATARASLAPEVRDWEPEAALFAGPSGFEVLWPLVEGAPAHLRTGGILALEVGLEQADAVTERIARTGRFQDGRTVPDLAGRERVVIATRAED